MNTNETNEIIVTDDLGNEEHFFVVEQTVINGTTYLLVTASEDDDEAEAYMLKDTSAAGDEMAVYTEVEDELEREAVAGIFRQMIEDAELR